MRSSAMNLWCPVVLLALSLGLGLLVSSGPSNAEQNLTSTDGQPALDHLRKDLEKRENLVWTGHLNPDTDSVAGSLLAAFIHGGEPTLPGPINPESLFALEECGAEAPTVLDDFSGMQVALVDFNQSTQLAPSIDPESIVAIIDHHSIGGSPIVMSDVVSFEIRPWGSSATILADQARMLGIELPIPLACMGLAAILSDTVNLTSPSTTDYDRHYAESLAAGAGIEDIDDFAERMLLAKSDLSSLSAEEIVLLDYKDFQYGGKAVGIGVAETLTAQDLIDRKDELKAAMQQIKAESGLDHLVFAIVDTRNDTSYLLWGDEEDKDIVTAAFGDEVTDDMSVAEDVVSRKRQIGPAIQRAVEAKTSD